MGFDVGSMNANDLNKVARIEPIFDANGAPYEGCWIEIVGIDSERFRERERELQRNRLDRATSGTRVRVTPEEIEREGLETLARCTVAWGGWERDGQPWPCNTSNARELYTLAPWIREQINVAMGNRRNFFSHSENGSAKP